MPWTAACQASLFITNSQSSLKLISIELVMPFNHLILCHPLLLLPSIFASIRVFSNESVLHVRWPKYWSFSFNISPSNEHSGLISFRMDCLDLLVVQGTLKSLLQNHSSKASILQHSAFFIVQLSHRLSAINEVSSAYLRLLIALLTILIPGCASSSQVNHELPDVQAGFRKGRGTRDQIVNIHWIIEKAREFQKNIYFCFIAYAKVFVFSSLQFSHSVVSDSLQPHESQHTRPPCPSPTTGVYETHAHQVGDAIQPSHPLSSPPLPAPNPSQHQGLFQ